MCGTNCTPDLNAVWFLRVKRLQLILFGQPCRWSSLMRALNVRVTSKHPFLSHSDGIGDKLSVWHDTITIDSLGTVCVWADQWPRIHRYDCHRRAKRPWGWLKTTGLRYSISIFLESQAVDATLATQFENRAHARFVYLPVPHWLLVDEFVAEQEFCCIAARCCVSPLSCFLLYIFSSFTFSHLFPLRLYHPCPFPQIFILLYLAFYVYFILPLLLSTQKKILEIAQVSFMFHTDASPESQKMVLSLLIY